MATDEPRIPIADALPGLGVHPLPERWTPLEALIPVKCLDEKGQPTWSYRTTQQLNREELLGALVVQVELLRRELVEEWTSE
jgi:hypothetical protein